MSELRTGKCHIFDGYPLTRCDVPQFDPPACAISGLVICDDI
ncbi:hypothetical protein THTE_1307 [Thermogutta terrifontis]|uniref:Uncharacterized protein n=1 Tax=Thermogutta terrifontis TaxID=1331910 RepID=A0A286RD70_9BACT|nr:hypothetical protein THTE_1307 [Thermogutta terrifontis]